MSGALARAARSSSVVTGATRMRAGRSGRGAAPDPRSGYRAARPRRPPRGVAAGGRPTTAGQRPAQPPALRPRPGPAVLRRRCATRARCSTVHGPSQEGTPLHDVLSGMVKPPFFPVNMSDFRGELRFHDLEGPADFSIGSIRVKARSIPHIGHTLGYRLEADGRVLTYISDHQAPVDRHDRGQRGARPLRRRRPGDPRRSVLGRGVPAAVRLGPLDAGLRGAGGPGGGGPPPQPVPPRPRPHRQGDRSTARACPPARVEGGRRRGDRGGRGDVHRPRQRPDGGHRPGSVQGGAWAGSPPG